MKTEPLHYPTMLYHGQQITVVKDFEEFKYVVSIHGIPEGYTIDEPIEQPKPTKPRKK